MLTKIVKTLLMLTYVSVLFSCSNVITSFDYDNSTDFSLLKTYQWDKKPSSGFSTANPLVDKRIIKSIEKNMHQKGLAQSDSADIKLSYQISFMSASAPSVVSAGVGMSVGAYNRGQITLNSSNQITQSIQSVLIIDMVSSSNNSLIWRTTTTRLLSGREATPEESQRRIDQMIFRLFEHYPPKK